MTKNWAWPSLSRCMPVVVCLALLLGEPSWLICVLVQAAVTYEMCCQTLRRISQ